MVQVDVKIVMPIDVFNDIKQPSDSVCCSICTSPFSGTEDLRKPRTLPACGHTFCKECIGKVVGPKPKKVSVKLPANPPCNWSLMQVIEEQRLENERVRQEQILRVENPIVPCYEDPGHESTVYCKNCSESFCDKCFTRVHNSNIFGKHEKISFAEKPIVLPKCPTHPEKEAVFVCLRADCAKDNIGCEMCRNDVHFRHRTSNILPKLEEYISKMSECLEKLTEKESKDREIAKAVTDNHEGLDAIAEDHKQRIVEHFKTLLNEALLKYVLHNVQLEARFCATKQKSDDGLEEIGEIKEEMERCLKRKTNLHEANELMKKAKKVLDKKMCWGDLAYPLKDYEFNPDMSVNPRVPAKYSQLNPNQNNNEI